MKIKKLTSADSFGFLNLLLTLDNETKFMMLEPNERNVSSEDMTLRLSKIDETNSVLFGAFDDGNLVGYVNVLRGDANRIRHSAYIAMGILLSYTGQGIGKLLLNKVDEWARKYGVTRLELTVMAHNEKAIKLYEKMGFNKEGIKKNSILIDGNYIDEYYMGKIL